MTSPHTPNPSGPNHYGSGDPNFEDTQPIPVAIPHVISAPNIAEHPDPATRNHERANLAATAVALVNRLEDIRRQHNRPRGGINHALTNPNSNLASILSPAALANLQAQAQGRFDPDSHAGYQEALAALSNVARDMDPDEFRAMMLSRSGGQHEQFEQRAEAHQQTTADLQRTRRHIAHTSAAAGTYPTNRNLVVINAAAKVQATRQSRSLAQQEVHLDVNSGIGEQNRGILEQFEKQRSAAIESYDNNHSDANFILGSIRLGGRLNPDDIERMNDLFAAMAKSLDPDRGGLGLRDRERASRLEELVRMQYLLAARQIHDPYRDPAEVYPCYRNFVEGEPLLTRSIVIEDKDGAPIYLYEDGSQLVARPNEDNSGVIMERRKANGELVTEEDLPNLRSYKEYPPRRIKDENINDAVASARTTFSRWETARTPGRAESAHDELSSLEAILEIKAFNLERDIYDLDTEITSLSGTIADPDIADDQRREVQQQLDAAVEKYKESVQQITELRKQLNPLSYMRRLIEAGSPNQTELHNGGLPARLGHLVLGPNNRVVEGPVALPRDDMFTLLPNGNILIEVGTFNCMHGMHELWPDGSSEHMDPNTGMIQFLPPEGPTSTYRDVSHHATRRPRPGTP